MKCVRGELKRVRFRFPLHKVGNIVVKSIECNSVIDYDENNTEWRAFRFVDFSKPLWSINYILYQQY